MLLLPQMMTAVVKDWERGYSMHRTSDNIGKIGIVKKLTSSHDSCQLMFMSCLVDSNERRNEVLISKP